MRPETFTLTTYLLVGVCSAIPPIVKTVRERVWWFQKPSDEAHAIADLIECDPKGWSCDKYYLTHRSTMLQIWVNTGPERLRWQLASQSGLNETLPGYHDQRWVWAAYQNWLKVRPVEHTPSMKAALKGLTAVGHRG